VHITFGVLLLRGEKGIARQAIGPGIGYFDNQRILSSVDCGGDIYAELTGIWFLARRVYSALRG
jgi:hypothetical protein